MKDFILIQDGEYIDTGKNQRIYVFSNVDGYEERIENMFENSMSLNEIENIINSWGGHIDYYFLNDLVKCYKKNNSKGLPL